MYLMKRQRHYNIQSHELKLLYENGYSQSKLSEYFKCSHTVIENRMKEYNIERRSYAKASSIRNKTIKLNESQEQLIIGSLLGDACLVEANYISNKKSKSKLKTYRLLFAHSEKQIEYLKHKKNILGGSKIGTRKSGHGATIKHFAFCSKPTLEPFAKICLRDNKKSVTKEWLSQLKPEGLAYWFMDDGYTIKRSRTSHGAYLCTDSFNEEEIKLIQDCLIRMGLETKVSHTKTGPRVRFPSTDITNLLFDIIKPWVIKSMEYKLVGV